MATAPYGVRLLVGAAVTAIEETLKLPQTIAMYPMTLASNLAQVAMKMQQDLADLAIKGDSALEGLFPPKDEHPEWATFDEDDADNPAPWPGDGARRTEGRFALYSVTDDEDPETPGKATTKAPTAKPRTAKAASSRTARKAPPKTTAKAAVSAPPIAVELDYESLTLAQLRARMPSLSVTDLRALLAYEEAAKARAPFQTLLANRITRTTAK
ncbi:MAG: lipid droplet-associated protein [Mycobacteriaceae bacterium]